MKLLGFIGPKTSGKDAAYEILKAKGRVAGKIAFAGPLKEICSEVFGINATLFNDPVLKEKPLKESITLTRKHFRSILKLLLKWLPETDPVKKIRKYNIDTVSISGLEGVVITTPRQLLQFIGTEFIRDRVYKNWHVEAALGEYALAQKDDTKNYAITDIRFENELEFILENLKDMSEIYYVERPEAEEVLKTATHPSELTVVTLRKMLGEDRVIKNNGTLEDYEAKILELSKPSKEEPKKKGTTKTKKSKFVYGSRDG